MRVSEIMTTDIGLVRMDSTIREAAQMMVDCDCGALPVVEDERGRRLIGMITDRDIAVRAVARGMDPSSTRVADCMSTDIATVDPDANVNEVERIMAERQVRRVPVVADGCVCGMVAQADIALARPPQEAAEVVQEVSKPYVG